MFGYTFGVISAGLEVFRKAIDITNRNILNANNPDYAQEEPVITNFAPAGVNLQTIKRIQNFYYLSLRNDKLSTVYYLKERVSGNSQVEDIFQEFTQGLGGTEYINDLFGAYQDLMKDPTNEGAKAQLINSAKSLVSYLRDRINDLDRINNGIDYNLRNYISQVNDLTKKIAELNKDILIQYAQTYANGQDYKNLLDQRDQYLKELSQLINIRVQEDDLGRVRVETSQGFVLVEDGTSWDLSYDGGSRKVYWNSKDGSKVDISSLLTSGKIKGLLDFSQDISSYMNKLDSVAKALISQVKVPLRQGYGNTFYYIQNVSNPTAPLGISKPITLNGSSSVIITPSPTDSLNDLANTINAAAVGFTASVVANPDGTYTLKVVASDPNYTIQDQNGKLFKAEGLFTGTSVRDIDLNPNVSDMLQNMDYSLADEFDSFSVEWWNTVKGQYQNLLNDVSSNLNSLKNRQDRESALLNSLDAKLQEMQGVSIDAEFMRAMELQRSYEALAKIVNAMDELIRTTLNMV
ncbi:flagellar hook-associated protein FlgK [Thermocrinis minervae]|uniref:Flagellar hook-associated protein 1 n=1 Tax=Thermocrinis minervae TaxID=381751 RepID=A0A1M6S2W1_9AQUI|nr:flagellar hook-associated protein FlgK [Thermocrinis minervae]SHK39075.1 flagellar hook-associated protein 1 FlgK [Thermocrinis minervae]